VVRSQGTVNPGFSLSRHLQAGWDWEEQELGRELMAGKADLAVMQIS
jgi:hypothetical protein